MERVSGVYVPSEVQGTPLRGLLGMFSSEGGARRIIELAVGAVEWKAWSFHSFCLLLAVGFDH